MNSLKSSVKRCARLLALLALVAGAATFNTAENPPSQIAAGQLVFDIDVMPPPPAERLTFNVYIDSTLLSQLGSTTGQSATAANA